MMALKTFYHDDHTLEIGIDESGRGCLLGPVYAGAVIWDPEITSPLIKDSKKLTHEKRLKAYRFIKQNAIAYGVGIASVEEVDEHNILQATMIAMHRAIDNCRLTPQHILVDGSYFKLYSDKDDNSISYTTVVDGDNKYYSIAAGSIVAKVERDLYINLLCDQYPDLDHHYDIRSNKGYGTPSHIQNIRKHKITPFHRTSFKPCQF